MSSHPGSAPPPSTWTDRAEGIARIIPRIGQPQSHAEAAQRLADAIRDETHAAAVAVLLDEGSVVTRAALSGFTLAPPEGLPATFAPDELARLARWGEQLGIGPVELAPIVLDDRQLGLVVVFSGGSEPLGDEQLRVLGAIVGYALEHARTVEDLRRAYDTQQRTQDQVVRTERLRVLGEMALGVAHDFNNVLNAMLGQVGVLELLAGRHPDLDDPIQRLKRVALEGATTVERLQDFTRQRRDRDFDDVDLSELVAAIVTDARTRAGDNCVFADRLERGVHIAGNSSELRQALVAVVDNALDAGAHRVTATVQLVEDEARLVLSDDGCGMSREVRKRAFDPYFTTKGPLSSGLGLSVAYGIVRRHGGRIELESTPGHGTRVKIRIPTPVAAEAEAEAERAGRVVPRIGGARILLVEDDEDNREAMATLLGLGGHEVTAASSGAEGMRRFDGARFDLVLTDLGLPDMSGWEVARHIKDVSSLTPVALITGWAMTLAPEEIRRRGVDLLIKKPIDPRKFLQQLSGIGRPS